MNRKNKKIIVDIEEFHMVMVVVFTASTMKRGDSKSVCNYFECRKVI